MNRKKIDLSNIKTNNLDEITSFSNSMTRSQRLEKMRVYDSSNDIDDIINEKRKKTNELSNINTKYLYKKENNILNDKFENNLAKTQILDLTRQMKFNFEEICDENTKKKKHGVSPLNIVGELNLICMGYYIYLLAFTNYQDIQSRYILNGIVIVLMVLFFGLSIISNKKICKIFYILNIIIIFLYVLYNIYTLVY